MPQNLFYIPTPFRIVSRERNFAHAIQLRGPNTHCHAQATSERVMIQIPRRFSSCVLTFRF